jgi:hypothetical protein
LRVHSEREAVTRIAISTCEISPMHVSNPGSTRSCRFLVDGRLTGQNLIFGVTSGLPVIRPEWRVGHVWPMKLDASCQDFQTSALSSLAGHATTNPGLLFQAARVTSSP